VADNATALVFRVLAAPSPGDVEALAAFGAAHGVRMYLQPGGLQTIAPLRGESWEPLFYALPEFDVRLEFEPSDFIQINGPLNRRMVQTALALLDPQPGDRVLDLFCGLGNFTLPLARKAGAVLGVEGDQGL